MSAPGARPPAGEAAGAVPDLLVEGLRYRYPDGVEALRGVDLVVRPGERVALLGPNGAGKTTLVLHLNGILGGADVGGSEGSVAVGGLPVRAENLPEIRGRVGIVFQDPDDQLFMPTVRQDVAFGPANQGLRGAELAGRVRTALEQVGLAELAERPPHHLSYGQRRRAALATVLAMRPRVLVLDEPSANLDPASRREFAEVLRSLDTTLVMVTHDLPYALELCPRSAILADGVIAADGPTPALLADDALLRRYRLELPYGFSVPAAGPGA
ncbi:energy-coupling factor ABC transporter ATP-binding protein [Allonocardiopsis opalescens]|uniref:Cobalt/nickel transport system ATP-binding protein n=1 Tax=Allonocardiopsis opalescens TaxID=1144618 RepID=A0A2T0PX74_9ACTN|nr:ABC transporter ATP-binding protein [Allonocardiopsis opalescens]PRX96135.1 cobalt/nickel transport system ATP-binding protein [Allonocardiopsis opalescens]